jgi:predicted histidine transporter YuiF (NhaC family)
MQAAITHHSWPSALWARQNAQKRKRREVSQDDKHMDVNVSTKQVMSLPVVLQLAGMLGAIAVTYSTMVANDREHATAIEQLKRDVARIEKDTKDLKVEILGELREIRNDLRERQKGK